MPRKKFALKENGPPSLEISWEGEYQNVKISVDGKVIGIIPNLKSFSVDVNGKVIGIISNLKSFTDGRRFYLEDGSSLEVKVNAMKSWRIGDIDIRLNGKWLPEFISNYRRRLLSAYRAIFFVGIIYIYFGLIDILFEKGIIEGWLSVLAIFVPSLFMMYHLTYHLILILSVGVFFVAMGLLVKQKNIIGLRMAFILFLALTISNLILNKIDCSENLEKCVEYFELILGIRISILIVMFRGFKGIRNLKKI